MPSFAQVATAALIAALLREIHDQHLQLLEARPAPPAAPQAPQTQTQPEFSPAVEDQDDLYWRAREEMPADKDELAYRLMEMERNMAMQAAAAVTVLEDAA